MIRIHYTHLFGSSGSASGGDAEQLAAADDLDEIFGSEKKIPGIVGIDNEAGGKKLSASMDG